MLSVMLFIETSYHFISSIKKTPHCRCQPTFRLWFTNLHSKFVITALNHGAIFVSIEIIDKIDTVFVTTLSHAYTDFLLTLPHLSILQYVFFFFGAMVFKCELFEVDRNGLNYFCLDGGKCNSCHAKNVKAPRLTDSSNTLEHSI